MQPDNSENINSVVKWRSAGQNCRLASCKAGMGLCLIVWFVEFSPSVSYFLLLFITFHCVGFFFPFPLLFAWCNVHKKDPGVRSPKTTISIGQVKMIIILFVFFCLIQMTWACAFIACHSRLVGCFSFSFSKLPRCFTACYHVLCQS